ncbi:MAG TPA: M56 family metallopeptidase [Allosphingosinicella sp.]
MLLPAEASEWPLERRRLVLFHELAHVARRDSLSRSLASLVCALYWFHPGAWWAARQMRMEQEHAADDAVLMAGGSPQAYALSLLHLAGGAGAKAQFHEAAAMAGMYQLERRLVSITGAARRNRPGSVFLSSSALLAGFTTFVVAAGVPVSASSTSAGPLQAKRIAIDSSLEKDAGFATVGDSSTTARRSERIATVSPAIASERLARPSGAASEPGSEGAAGDGPEAAEEAPSRRDSAAAGESGPSNPAAGGSPDRRPSAQPQQLRDYGWELPRRDSKVRIGSTEASSRPARITLPAPLQSASGDGISRPKWARNAPRLVQGGTPTRSPLPTSQGPLMLSWSIEVGAK